MQTVTLNEYKNTMSLAEISQTKEIRMAYVHREEDGSFTQLHDSVKCRDFLGDVLFSEEVNRKINIYGFKWNPKENKIDRDRLRLVLDFKGDVDTLNTFIRNVTIIHDIERQHKLTLTRIRKVKGHKDYLIIEASKFWLKSIFNISLYTYLLKVMGYPFNTVNNWKKELTQMHGIEANYYKQTKSVWDFYVSNLRKLAQRTPSCTGEFNPKQLDDYKVHNNSGFCSRRFFNGSKGWFAIRLTKLWKEYNVTK